LAVGLVVGLAAVSLVAAWAALCFSDLGGLLCVRPPLFVKESSYRAVLEEIGAGRITTGPEGTAPLPGRYTGLTPRDEVFIDRRPGGVVLVLFPVWYGRGGDLQGYLHASRPLADADYYTVDWGPGGVHQHLTVAGVEFLSAEPVRPPWYWVWRRVD
jgi:hypothetical protein